MTCCSDGVKFGMEESTRRHCAQLLMTQLELALLQKQCIAVGMLIFVEIFVPSLDQPIPGLD